MYKKSFKKISIMKEKVQAYQIETLMNDEGVSVIDGILGAAIGMIIIIAIFSIALVIGFIIDGSALIGVTSNPVLWPAISSLQLLIVTFFITLLIWVIRMASPEK